MEPFSAVLILGGIKIISGIVSAIGLIFGVFKVISWIKNKFTSIEDTVVGLKQSLDTNFVALRDDVKDQTKVISAALGEQRQDFRTFYGPTLLMLQQSQLSAPVKAKPKARVRKK